jgi:2-phospho-L-lactate/phosphoenolpyruvate guanylyltransferase
MTPWVLVPARSFATGKSRLGALGRRRAELAQALLEHVLAVTTATPGLAGILVATDGDDVAALARRRGAAVLADAAPRGLADVVDRGLATLAERGARAALVLMADLPLLTSSDVTRLTRALAGSDLVLAPDRDRLGTNALATHLPAAPTCLGHPDSFCRHVAAACGRGDRLVTLDRDGLAFDLDGPADLADLLGTRAPPPAPGSVPPRTERGALYFAGRGDEAPAAITIARIPMFRPT